MSVFDEFCQKNVQLSINRLLGLLDRDPFTNTYGCFDKSYHYLRTADFANSAAQMSALTLALIYKNPSLIRENKIHKDQWRDWATAAMTYTWKLQKKDGSFDEWYPNERGWAGPTGYVLYTQIATYHALSESFSEVQKKWHLDCIRRSAYFMARFTEVGDLANHYAISLLPIYMAAELLEDRYLKLAYEGLSEKFLSLVRPEGWSLEYDGVDISYNLATLSFLARIHQMNHDERWLKYAQQSFQFLIYHFYPDGTFSGSISSRHTSHIYPYAIKYWAQFVPEAYCAFKSIEAEIWRPHVVTPSEQDDHYLHYLLWDYLQALGDDRCYNSRITSSSCELPYHSDELEKYFPESGIFIKSTPTKYLVANLKRGGAVKVFHKKDRQLIFENCGYVVRLKDKKILTNLISQPKPEIQYVLSREIACKSVFGKIFEKRFTIGTFLLFRVIMLFVFTPKVAYFFKGFVKKILIFQQSSNCLFLKRHISFTQNDSILISDELSVSPSYRHCLDSLYQGGHFYSRYVPQSRYSKVEIPYHSTHKNSEMLTSLKASGQAQYSIELM